LQELHAAGSDCRHQVPQVVVLGSQSSGKSSLLEMILGTKCFPTAAGICTRVPILLQLKNCPNCSAHPECSECSSCTVNGQRMARESVRDEVKRIMEHLVGARDDVMDTTITIEMSRPDVPSLTLVDLPGMVDSATDSQQADFPTKTKDLARRYADAKNAIILAVLEASQQDNVGPTMDLVKELDPKGERTVGVFTKVDAFDPQRMDHKMILDKISEKIKSPKFSFLERNGYFAVWAGRNQADIDRGNVTLEQGILRANDFFANGLEMCPEHRPALENRLGVIPLREKLHMILAGNIKSFTKELLCECRPLSRAV